MICICISMFLSVVAILPTNPTMTIKNMVQEAFQYLQSCIWVVLPRNDPITPTCLLNPGCFGSRKCLEKIKESMFQERNGAQLQGPCRLLVTFQLRPHGALGCTWDLPGDIAGGLLSLSWVKRYTNETRIEVYHSFDLRSPHGWDWLQYLRIVLVRFVEPLECI